MDRRPALAAPFLAAALVACMGGGLRGSIDAGPDAPNLDVAAVDAAALDTLPDRAAWDGVPVEYGVTVVARYPHDPEAFTQGLVFADGALYEGTGLYGESSLRLVELATGQVLRQVDLSERYFGEGVAVVGDRIVQLTWRNQVGFVYDRQTFGRTATFDYETEGWGITRLSDGRLVMSDGTAWLRFLDSASLEETGSIEVRDDRGPVRRLNELEQIDGAVWANVWQTDAIVIIDPASGAVTGRVDLSGLLDPADVSGHPDDVSNGIAWDEAGGRIFVTGKRWPWLFEVTLVVR